VTAATSRVFVHRFKWSHAGLRADMRRRLKAGTVKLLSATPTGWLYEVPS